MQIDVDFDDPSDLKRVITRLQKRRKKLLADLGYGEVSFAGSKLNMDSLMPAIEGIFDTDLSCIYGVASAGASYVYFHCDPTKPLNPRGDIRAIYLASKFGLKFEPVYVGKGVGDRCFDLQRNDSHRKIRSALISKGLDLEVVVAADGLSDGAALAMESKLIDVLGLRALSKTGWLVNLDEGCMASERRRRYPESCKLVLKKNGYRIT